MVPIEFRKGHHHPTHTESLGSVHHSNPSCWGHSASPHRILQCIWSTCLLHPKLHQLLALMSFQTLKTFIHIRKTNEVSVPPLTDVGLL